MSLARVCVVYEVKEVASFRGFGQLMGMARNSTCTCIIYTPYGQ